MSVDPQTISTITVIATVLAAIASSVAVIAACISAYSWCVSQRFNSRCNAVQVWVGGAAAFNGRLKFIYKEKLSWPQDKIEVKYLSGHFLLGLHYGLALELA